MITAVLTGLAGLASGFASGLTSVLAQTGSDVPDEMGYVWGSYALVVVVLVGYAVVTIRRGRAVGRRLPPEERRWM